VSYRLTEDAGLVLVRREDGTAEWHSNAGPEIPWLGEEQARSYVRLGLVEEVDE
jgi:hypothetical protein